MFFLLNGSFGKLQGAEGSGGHAATQQQSVSVFPSPTWLHIEPVDDYIYGKSQLSGKSSWCQTSHTGVLIAFEEAELVSFWQ